MDLPYLENMNKKIIPKTQKSFFVIAKKEDNEADNKESKEKEYIENIDKEEIHEEEKQEKKDEIKKQLKREQIEIIDKRDTSTIDRDLIMERIRNKEKTLEKITQERIIEEFKEESDEEKESVESDKEDEEVVIKKKAKIVISKKTEDKEEKEDKEIDKQPVVVIKRRGKKVEAKTISQININDVEINGRKIKDRIPITKEKIRPKASSYYMNNRKLSIEKINKILLPYKDSLKEIKILKDDDEDDNIDFKLMTHQKVVKDYLNVYSPYRGLLLLHGLGSGKTCTSIAIAEGMKTDRQIILMTPASLKKNFFAELKKCADPLFKKFQHWEFISAIGQPELIDILSSALSLPKEFIKKNEGAWLTDKKKKSNFSSLKDYEQKIIDEQLDEMIRSKYLDINYNSPTLEDIVAQITKGNTINPFDNSVVIIDEAHNFVSRIVNKIKTKETKKVSYQLYELLMKATNVRIVLLTGTPIINYPNEISVLFNILRGYIKTWTFTLTVNTDKKITKETILEMFEKEDFNIYDYVEYSGNKLTITRNPFGFINTKKRGKSKYIMNEYDGIKLDETGNVSDNDFKKIVTKILKKNNLEINDKSIKIDNHTALPDKSDDFISMFIDEDNIAIKKENLFKRRILGLTSYFKSASEELLPEFVLSENKSVFHLVTTEMSETQFSEYQKIRKDEADKTIKQTRRKAKKQAKEGEELFSIASNYRIGSRLCCNFVFPNPPGRPMPDKKTITEENIDNIVIDDDDEGLDMEFKEKQQHALKYLQENAEDYLIPEKLEEYSPKFLEILNNLKDKQHTGLHLLYSQFRTMEGIGILKIILEANGFAEFNIIKTSTGWELLINDEDVDKPKFFLHTGTEDADKKEILLNIYNSRWDNVPSNIRRDLEKLAENNFLGEIVKIMMITASGSEGINLKNTRYVHIMEPYWNMARLQQVIGRARRLESHEDLPKELRTVQVFLYMSTLSKEQTTDDKNKELIIRDISKLDKKTVLTTDETLYEICRIKENINQQIMKSIKETSIDCTLYPNNENLTCFDYGKIKSNDFGSLPSIKEDEQQKDDTKIKKIKLINVTDVDGKEYKYNKDKNEIYESSQVKRAQETGEQLIPIGNITKEGRKNKINLFD